MTYHNLGYIELNHILCRDPYYPLVQTGAFGQIHRKHGGAVVSGTYSAKVGFESGQLKEIVLSLWKDDNTGIILDVHDVIWEFSGEIKPDSKSVCLINNKIPASQLPDLVSDILTKNMVVDDNIYSNTIANDLFLAADMHKFDYFWRDDVGIIVTGIPTDTVKVYYANYQNHYAGYKIVF